jgi:hypothetical protein
MAYIFQNRTYVIEATEAAALNEPVAEASAEAVVSQPLLFVIDVAYHFS